MRARLDGLLDSAVLAGDVDRRALEQLTESVLELAEAVEAMVDADEQRERGTRLG